MESHTRNRTPSCTDKSYGYTPGLTQQSHGTRDTYASSFPWPVLVQADPLVTAHLQARTDILRSSCPCATSPCRTRKPIGNKPDIVREGHQSLRQSGPTPNILDSGSIVWGASRVASCDTKHSWSPCLGPSRPCRPLFRSPRR